MSFLRDMIGGSQGVVAPPGDYQVDDPGINMDPEPNLPGPNNYEPYPPQFPVQDPDVEKHILREAILKMGYRA